MKERVYVVSLKTREALGALRGFPTLQVGLTEDEIWLKGFSSTEEQHVLLKKIPVSHSYELDEQGYYFPLLGLTPIGKLNKLEWIAITLFIQPQFPTSAMPGKVTEHYPVSLVPSDHSETGSALVCALSTWKSYADSAPDVRLSRFRYAVSQSGQVLVVGSPLPAIPGQEYWQRDRILLPCGYDFEIPFISTLLARRLNPENDSVVLFGVNGTWELIALKYIIPATRSGVRLTEEGHADEL